MFTHTMKFLKGGNGYLHRASSHEGGLLDIKPYQNRVKRIYLFSKLASQGIVYTSIPTSYCGNR